MLFLWGDFAYCICLNKITYDPPLKFVFADIEKLAAETKTGRPLLQ